jgi:hypothetical protein
MLLFVEWRRPRGRAEEVAKQEKAVWWARQEEHSFECREKLFKLEKLTGSKSRERQEQGQQGERGERAKGRLSRTLRRTKGGSRALNGAQKRSVVYQCGGVFVVLCARPGAVRSAAFGFVWAENWGRLAGPNPASHGRLCVHSRRPVESFVALMMGRVQAGKPEDGGREARHWQSNANTYQQS